MWESNIGRITVPGQIRPKKMGFSRIHINRKKLSPLAPVIPGMAGSLKEDNHSTTWLGH
jgi:hypothetical protein